MTKQANHIQLLFSASLNRVKRNIFPLFILTNDILNIH